MIFNISVFPTINYLLKAIQIGLYTPFFLPRAARARPSPAPAVSRGNAETLRRVSMATKWKEKDKEKDKEVVVAQEEDKMIKDEEAMAWKFLSLTQINSLLEHDVAGVQKYLELHLDLKQHKTSLKEAVLLDYYVSGFWWAKKMDFSTVQVGGFMTLLNLLLENLGTEHMTLLENIQELRRTMVGIGQCHSEKSGGFEFFTVDQAKAIVDYLKISLFQHYALYEYLFHSPREELVIGDENVVELVKPADAPFPAPLEEGLPCDIYSSFIALIPAAEDVIEEMEGSVHEEEQPEAEAPVDPLAGYCVDDVKLVLGKMTCETIVCLQTEINERLQMQEEAYSVRIEKLKKA
ncbi:ciliary-associated calcium-binding coiled-coil protein 1 [Eublepharis macularius]|uniref:Ciliary-associated calcium-binding coiled-coil protein 1 n=1 Tax=Eublepharis macularius TaxID=481883 RepID=A0AA97JKB7_EUBMA|nr:ciliary-associated calcium-binding coiled-coil protein 1 [Eublepharis macularius]